MHRATAPIALLIAALTLSACAVAPPTGPSVMALPPQGKSFEQFQQDDATCQQKGAEDSKAYEECRKGLAEAQARQSAMQEQKRRDFDRVLGAGTDGQNNY